ncbi:hypothetical protein GGS26DRAFT_530225 [Hypomontagnella submonticulosa]|nr:hypothetical protein GGS26DRAFT_530225 [Hypomontagnella submonticulosa]
MAHGVFFDGNLQDGIALAIQQTKMVLAFVTDSSEESQLWENELLTNDSLKSPLENHAVALRLVAGSEEAGFLEALFPIPKKPTVVIIQNGTLKEYIQGGTAKEDLVRRIAAIISTAPGSQSQQAPAQAPSQPPQPPRAPAPARSTDVDDLYDDYDIPATSSTTTPAAAAAATTSASAQATTSQQGQSSQQARRPESEKKTKEAKGKGKAKAEQEAPEKPHRESGGGHDAQPSDPKSPEKSYAEEVRQRKIQANEERKRILKRIEDDKRARREREAEEKQARLLLSATQDDQGSTSQSPAIPLTRAQGGGSHGDHCNLQVRLFDGSTIRSRFPNDATLRSDVRKWIDQDRTDGDAPYTFRVVLTPLPNKAIEPAEETESLQSLGLCPSATLVLVPGKFARAYGRPEGFLMRLIGYLVAFTAFLFRIQAHLLSQIAATANSLRAPGQPAAEEEIPLRSRGSTRIQGFRNQEDQRRDAQLYNGNSLNFEPRRDDEDEDEDTGNGR